MMWSTSFTCLLAIRMSFLVRRLFTYFDHFPIGLFILLQSYKSYLPIPDIYIYILDHICDLQMFSSSLWFSFNFLNSAFRGAELFNFPEVHFTIIFFLWIMFLGLNPGTHSPAQERRGFSPMFSSRWNWNFSQLSGRNFCTLPGFSGQTVPTTCGWSV